MLSIPFMTAHCVDTSAFFCSVYCVLTGDGDRTCQNIRLRGLLCGAPIESSDMLQMNDTKKLKLECSLFTPEAETTCAGGGIPLVIYCHCNSGSRRDSEEALHVLMQHGIRVFALDFAVSICLHGLASGLQRVVLS